jgi:hypothetical protein
MVQPGPVVAGDLVSSVRFVLFLLVSVVSVLFPPLVNQITSALPPSLLKLLLTSPTNTRSYNIPFSRTPPLPFLLHAR